MQKCVLEECYVFALKERCYKHVINHSPATGQCRASSSLFPSIDSGSLAASRAGEAAPPQILSSTHLLQEAQLL